MGLEPPFAVFRDREVLLAIYRPFLPMRRTMATVMVLQA